MKKAAKYMLENPNQVAIHSMRTIAKKAAVHPTTMVRLAQKLSFDGYQDLRILYQDQFKPDVNSNATLAQALLSEKAASDTANMINNTQMAVIENLNACYSNVDPELLEATAKTIWNSNHLYIVGFRSNFSVASLFYYRVLQFTPDATLIDAKTSMHGGKLRYIKPGDLMIVIGNKPYSKAAIEMVNFANEKGAGIIAITDSVVSPLAIKAKHTFILPAVEESGFNYLLPALAVSNLIMTSVIREGGDKSVQRLEYSDKNMEDFFSYD